MAPQADVRIVRQPPASGSAHAQGCCCSACEPPPAGCDITCPERPAFHCGQLLREDDLTSVVDWTRERLRLQRLSEGWGVVCGLEAVCDGPCSTRVRVRPGVAVTCCGNDVVLCEEVVVDLAGACKAPCAAPTQAAAATATAGPSQDPWVLVDLWVEALDQPIAARAVFGRGACPDSAECEPTRVRESARVGWTLAKPGAGTHWEAWEAGFENCESVVNQFGAQTFTSMEELRCWLQRQLHRVPPTQFCWLDRLVAALPTTGSSSPDLAAASLFWMVQDCRNEWARRCCVDCTEPHRVHLARVRLHRGDPNDPSCPPKCCVEEIDPYPPHKRLLGPGAWPAPPGRVNGAEVLWWREEDARVRLADRGVELLGTVVRLVPDDQPALADLLDLTRAPFVEIGRPHVLVVVDHGPQGRRVVGVPPAEDVFVLGLADPRTGEEIRRRGLVT